MKPLLLLDVDGPLNPTLERVDKRLVSPHRDGETPYRYHRRMYSTGGSLAVPVTLADEWAAELTSLRQVFDLVWATTWEDGANRLFYKYFRFPPLPVIRWPVDARSWTSREMHRGSWKTRHILAWLSEQETREGGPRPWVWVDDEIGAADRRYVSVHYGDEETPGSAVPRWLFRIEDHHGLRANDFVALHDWAAIYRDFNSA